MKGQHAVLLVAGFLVVTLGLIFVLVFGFSSERATVVTSVRPIAAAALPDKDSEGAKVLVANCIACHAIPDPASHTAPEWPPVVRRMSSHMAAKGMRGLTPADAQTVADYLVRHAKQP